MAIKAFLDTNIILDVFYADRPFHQEAVKLFGYIDRNMIIPFYSESVVTTTAYVLSKRMTNNQIREVILNLNRKIEILSCHSTLINQAIKNNPPDFEDALLYEIALHHQLDYFITSNKNDFKKFKRPELKVLNATELNRLLMNIR